MVESLLVKKINFFIELRVKSEQVQQKLESFCSICLKESFNLEKLSEVQLPLTDARGFLTSYEALNRHLKSIGLDATKGVKNVLDSFVKQRYMYMGIMCPVQKMYDLLPKSRWFSQIGRSWNFDASRIYLKGKR